LNSRMRRGCDRLLVLTERYMVTANCGSISRRDGGMMVAGVVVVAVDADAEVEAVLIVVEAEAVSIVEAEAVSIVEAVLKAEEVDAAEEANSAAVEEIIDRSIVNATGKTAFSLWKATEVVLTAAVLSATAVVSIVAEVTGTEEDEKNANIRDRLQKNLRSPIQKTQLGVHD